MKAPLRIDIEVCRHGWATVTLSADIEVRFIASYTPRDSISLLAHAACALVNGLDEVKVPWNTEPVEYEFRFAAANGRARLEVHECPDHRRRSSRSKEPIAAAEGDTTEVCRAIWRGLRRLRGALPEMEYEAAWGHPFPTLPTQRLTDFFTAGASG